MQRRVILLLVAWTVSSCLEAHPGFDAATTSTSATAESSTSTSTGATSTTSSTSTSTSATSTSTATTDPTSSETTAVTATSSGTDESSTGEPGRVTEGLIVLYLFDEGMGDQVLDQSSVAPPLDLTIADTGAVTWNAASLTIDSSTIVAAAALPTKIVDSCQLTDEITVEAWVAPANDTQGGPARIVTLSLDTGSRNFTLGQNAAAYSMRLRTSDTGANGTPPEPTAAGVTTQLTHVAVTRELAGTERIYLDGQEVTIAAVTGDFSTWAPDYTFALVNEITLDRNWLGELALVAVYERALDAGEVLQNFDAGP